MKPEPDLRLEDLGGPFLGELHQRLFQMLGLHRIGRPHRLQQFRRKGRECPVKAQPLALGQRIADTQLPVVRNADDIARPRPLRRVRGRRPETAPGSRSPSAFFERTCSSFIPRSKCPEASRTKATRSRCLGSILA